ncbi:hypothetical protein ISF_08961 [Cordyceps fumosorosea ARSEF 2679]|uniref:BZIP transcription factor n=1 Tax=Cordyceps fumosorosea (strain ARSEF 2679) TaxID=1081104 RepID=A0A167LLN8_CORFA|nr:hypothetical protein ISF_08961 [Cordyceps fumosorosea ARSEF 2679]OAA53229.1 hypothetical protein ISF_08961 [Cordyceps fumosorosea ARSEF 2679]
MTSAILCTLHLGLCSVAGAAAIPDPAELASYEAMPSMDKKRARDRRSQQSLRDRKQKRITELEGLVARCKERHQGRDQDQDQAYNSHDAYAREISALRQQNKALVQRQELLKSLVLSWDEPDPITVVATAAEDRWTGTATLPPLGDEDHVACLRAASTAARTGAGGSAGCNNLPPPHTETSSHPRSETETLPIASALATSSSSSSSPPPPPWSRIPPHDDDFSNLETLAGCPWFGHASLIQSCPDTPHSPLDILYGSTLNPLADMIHRNSNRRPFRELERLATGWLAYLFTRWVCNPCPETYRRMPSFLRPVKEQLEIVHPMVLNMVPWSRVRVALIRAWPQYRDNYRDFFGLFACCIRIRWPWGEHVLERAADNTLVMRQDFYETLMSERGWMVTRDFVDQYPALFAGVHVESILYNFI